MNRRTVRCSCKGEGSRSSVSTSHRPAWSVRRARGAHLRARSMSAGGEVGAGPRPWRIESISSSVTPSRT